MRTYNNPILSGFHPDPSICRVDEDYYLVTSSFAFFPGIPVFHSRDLVHWQQLGHVLTRASQVELSGARASEGIFAATIRFYDGVFYVITTLLPGHLNFVVTATDPAGPWSDPYPIADAEGIDPSLFFDEDGTCWYTGNGSPEVELYEGHHTIWLQQFDHVAMKLVGQKRVIVDGGSDIKRHPIWIEGPHLYKVDGLYYLIAAEGGTEEAHSVVAFRSDRVTGPYESFNENPILTNRTLSANGTNPITCTGHADMVQTQNGEWWMVLLACRPYPPFEAKHYNTGRETFLAPVTWCHGWPVAGSGGRLEATYEVPSLPEHRWPVEYGTAPLSFRWDFAGPETGLAWNIFSNTCRCSYSLTERPGFLRLFSSQHRLATASAPAFIGVRVRTRNYTVTTNIEVACETFNGEAGLAVVQNNQSNYTLLISQKECATHVVLSKQAAGCSPCAVASENSADDIVALRISAAGKDIRFYYKTIQSEWRQIGDDQDGTILSTGSAGGFVGAYVGLYAVSPDRPSKSFADFDWFEYEGNDD